MPTKFSVIYERAIFKITDYSFLNAAGDYVRSTAMKNYLLSAIVDFQHACSVDLFDNDLENEQFNKELDEEIIEILALGVAYHWLSAKAMNSELFRNLMHKTDYNSYSPANLLKEVRTLRDSFRLEYTGKINTYSFRKGNIDTLKT